MLLFGYWALSIYLTEAPFPADHLKPVHLHTIYKIYNKQLSYVHTVASYSKKIQMNTVQVHVYTKQKHLGCKKGKANQNQQLSDYRCICT